MLFPDVTGRADTHHVTSPAASALKGQKDTALHQTQAGTAASCSLELVPPSAPALAQPCGESEQEAIWPKTTSVFWGLAQFSAPRVTQAHEGDAGVCDCI